MWLPCDPEMAVVGLRLTRGQVDALSEMITCPDNDFHPGHAELAIVLIYHSGEPLDQRFRHIPDAGAICLAEYVPELTLNAVNLSDIKLPMTRAGDEARDDDHLRDEIDQGRFASPLHRRSSAILARSARSVASLRGMGRKSDFACIPAVGRRVDRVFFLFGMSGSRLIWIQYPVLGLPIPASSVSGGFPFNFVGARLKFHGGPTTGVTVFVGRC